VIFGSGRVWRYRGNTSVFAGRNSSTPAFTTLGGRFVGAIPVRSGGGVGCYSIGGVVEEGRRRSS